MVKPGEVTKHSTRLQQWAKILKSDTLTVYYAIRHPKTPWLVKAVGALVVGYALSPIDLIPDFIPVLGYLDDVLIVPLGILLVRKLLPSYILCECRVAATERLSSGVGKPKSLIGAAVVILLWSFAVVLLARAFLSFFSRL